MEKNTIKITLTDTQFRGLGYAAVDPHQWAKNAVSERARIANDEIVAIYTARALDEGVQIPLSRESLVEDAFTRGWVKTAAENQAALEAELQNQAASEEASEMP